MKTTHYQSLVKFISPFAIAFLITMMPSFACGQGMNDIQWHSSVEQAKEIAKQQNKLVLLHFDADWCRPCRSLETYVFRSGAVKKAIAENVVPVKLDADKALAVVNEYDVSMVPFDVIITPGGRVITERRSPADAENYAKMISSTSTASRMLDKEKMGPIAHQKVIQNRALMGQNPAEFRVDGPETPELGLSKDGSVLQRRQAAFTDDSNAIRKANPFVNNGTSDAAAPSMQEDEVVSVEDLQRDEFLRRERNWAAPVQETRRAKPERIVNNRYFEKFATQPKPVAMPPQVVSNAIPQLGFPQIDAPQLGAPVAAGSGPYTLASGTSPVPVEMPTADHADMESFDLSLDANTAGASLEVPDELVPPAFSDDDLVMAEPEPEPNPIVEVEGDHSEYMEVASAFQAAEDKSKFCLKGKCPVTLITEGKWKDGDTRYGIVHRNRTYIFANAQALALFKTNPDKYSPILAGFDPVIFHEEGRLIDGLVENGVFMGRTPDQRVVLFLDQRTRAMFQTSPLQYMDTIRSATHHAGQGTIVR